jgi:2'-5' RNA ligase
VTLLIPFVPPELLSKEVLSRLRGLFAEFAPFAFTLAKIGRFPDVLYLAPEPSLPFDALSTAVQQAFPDYPPYGGTLSRAGTGNSPHLTVAKSPDAALFDRIVSELERHLPIQCSATHVWLMGEDRSGHWSMHTEFPFSAHSPEIA